MGTDFRPETVRETPCKENLCAECGDKGRNFYPCDERTVDRANDGTDGQTGQHTGDEARSLHSPSRDKGRQADDGADGQVDLACAEGIGHADTENGDERCLPDDVPDVAHIQKAVADIAECQGKDDQQGDKGEIDHVLRKKFGARRSSFSWWSSY